MASNTNVSNIALTGGLNVTSSDQMLAEGECMTLKNYEISTIGRYRRVKGYERFDGQLPPSQVIATALPGFPFAATTELIDAVLAEQLARRNTIEQVPGAGSILGVFGFDGEIFAFRNTVDNLAAKMYKATFGGWVVVTTPSLEPNGYYEIREGNFTGSVGTREVIGVDGKNPAFRFDGTTFTQITTSVSPDAPTHLEILPTQILLLSFRGGSFLYSAVGDPTKYSPVDGGGEIAVGHEITGMEVQADSTAAIFTRNRTFMLYGSSPLDFQLKALALRSGALEKTIQSMGSTIYLDDRGLTRLDRVQQFGDFEGATISQKVQTLFTQRLQNVRCSMVLREKNQYRIFFSDNTALTLTQYGSEVLGFTQIQLTFTPNCAWSGENTEGKESYFIGGEDGYVYQMESGNSFDCQTYASTFQTGFINTGAPEYKKRWRKLVLEAQSVTTLEAQYKCYYDYADPNIPLSDTMIGSGAKWDLSTWNDAIWGGASTSWSDLYIDGVSRSISVYMRTESNYYPPHELSLLMLHASPRGRRR